MGNQNATGIVEEEKASDEVPQAENHILPQAENKDFHENAADSDPYDAATEEHMHVENLKERGIENNGAEHNPPSGFPEVSEEASVTATEDVRAEIDAHDQLSPSKGEVEGSDSNLDSKSNLNSEPQEHLNIPDDSQEENEDLLLKESNATGEVSTSCHTGEKCHLIDTKTVQNLNVQNEEDELEVNEKASPEDSLPEISTRKEKSDNVNTERSAAISEPHDECLILAEEMIMSELGNGESMSNIGQNQPLDKAIDQLVNAIADQSEMIIESDSKKTEEEHEVGINSSSRPEKIDHVEEIKETENSLTSNPSERLKDTNEVMLRGIELGPTEESTATGKENGDEEATGLEGILEKAVTTEEDSSKTGNGHDTEYREGVADEAKYCACELTGRSLDNSMTQETDLAQSDQTDTITLKEAEIPSQGGIVHSLELKKSPSFDFGVSFDSRSEESDQTPLLYQDKTAIRSFSSCATLIRTSLQYDLEVGVEEKTIRLMERSNSENSRAPFMNKIKKEEKTSPLYKEEKQEKNGEDKDLQALESKEFGLNSPKGKRRPKSSIFTTCICCTEAIS
ncbi:uncharacterized protein Fot_53411 [Forsythia ovata]|uniref:Uncharacterized protein n=1 Tax=Forsythia ovata TaxID=205694 RepID=A0ABD1PIM2_9LAMI